MRLWSLAPELLDVKGLVALWREALLAKHVLEGRTKGYTHHPQVERFRSTPEPLFAINSYLYYVYLEAAARGYKFNDKKFDARNVRKGYISVTEGQILYEYEHLCEKLAIRDPVRYERLCRKERALDAKLIGVHPLFYIIPGDVESWEKIKKASIS